MTSPGIMPIIDLFAGPGGLSEADARVDSWVRFWLRLCRAG